MSVAVTTGVLANTAVALATGVVVSELVGWLENGPMRTICVLMGGGVSGRVERD